MDFVVTKRKKVLLADDAKLFLELEKTFLQRASVDILTAGNGEQALALARLHRPDVAVLDLNMPETDGDECCRAIKQDPRLQGTAVVMVTTEGRSKDLERCRAAGCDAVLLKPINRTEFLATVQKWLQLPARSERYKAKIQVQYGGETGNLLTKFSVDIGSGGLFICTDKPLDVEESVKIRFSLPSQPGEIACTGRVAWVNEPLNQKKSVLPPGMGVQFVDISPENLSVIHEFLAANQLTPSW